MADQERRIHAFENRFYRRMLGISSREHKRICVATGQYRRRVSGAFTVMHHKLSWFSHVCRHDTHLKIILQEQWMIVAAEEDLVNHGRTTSRNGQANRCHHCCTSRMTKVDEQSSQKLGVPQRHLCVTSTSQFVHSTVLAHLHHF